MEGIPQRNTQDGWLRERMAWRLLAGVLIFRILYIALVPFDLIHDEAYYWDWSRRLDWCYYSKPPGIAWLIALSTRIGGAHPFFVRLPAAVLSTIPVMLAYALGRRLFRQRTGLIAALLMVTTPGNAASGVMMTIDAPFLCCWSIALYGCWRMLERDVDRWKWTLVTSLAVGVGLLFKQTMLAFPVLTAIFTCLSPTDRREWRTPSFWLCGLGAAIALLPMLWWNSQHDWITFSHTRGHFDAEAVSWWRRLAISGEFFASQLGLLSPTTYVMMTVCAWLCLRHARTLSRPERFLCCFWLGPLLGVAALSLQQRVEANWPAPFYASGIILFAAAVDHRLPRLALPRWTLRQSLAVGAVSVAVTYLLPFAIVCGGLKGSPVDIAVRMWGWKELAHQVHHQLRALPATSADAILVTADRGVAAELAFYLPHHPSVALWDGNQRVDSQYDIWGMPPLTVGDDLLLIGKEQQVPALLRATFRDCELIGSTNVTISSQRSHQFQIWQARDFRGWY